MIIGVDLQKDREVLERAYNDSAGVTAEFNLNLLARANRELGADFDLPHWRHHAIYNERRGRIEMHLISKREQTVHVGGQEFRFRAAKKIITEYSYKYTPEGFAASRRQPVSASHCDLDRQRAVVCRFPFHRAVATALLR